MDSLQYRILVIGTSCSGKTTLSRRLGGVLALPVVELDELRWLRDWQERSQEEFARMVGEAVTGPAWIADGNYQVARDVLWPRGTHVVWLDYWLPLVLWRGLKRSLRRCLTGELICNGNRESLRQSFLSRNSILLWILTTHLRRRVDFAGLRRSGAFGHLEWLVFRDPRSAEAWLSELVNGRNPVESEKTT